MIIYCGTITVLGGYKKDGCVLSYSFVEKQNFQSSWVV